MKKFLFLFAFIALGLSVNAQTRGYMGSDTLTVSSAVDTIYLYMIDPDLADAKDLTRFDELEMFIRLDSLSGSAAATLTIEYTYASSPTETGVEWFIPAPASSYFKTAATTPTATASTTVNSFAVNGTSSSLVWHDANFTAAYARARLVVASSSQSLRMRGWGGVE